MAFLIYYFTHDVVVLLYSQRSLFSDYFIVITAGHERGKWVIFTGKAGWRHCVNKRIYIILCYSNVIVYKQSLRTKTN